MSASMLYAGRDVDATPHGRRGRYRGAAVPAIAGQLTGDWSDDASTLLYDAPSSNGIAPALRGGAIRPPPPRPPVHVTVPAWQPDEASARGIHMSQLQITVTVVAALIGAVAGAWSIQNRELRALPKVTVPVAAPAKVAPSPAAAKPSATPDVRIAAAVAPASPPAQPSVKVKPTAVAKPVVATRARL